MNHLKNLCYCLVAMMCIGLLSCKDNNDIPEPVKPDKPEEPVILMTAYDVLSEFCDKDISQEDNCLVFRYPRVIDDAGTLVFYHNLVDNSTDLSVGQYVRFSELTEDGVTLETWGDNINLKEVNNNLLSDVTVPELNPIATGHPSVTKVRLAITQVSTGLEMTGKYEDDSLEIDVTCELVNHNEPWGRLGAAEWNEKGKLSDARFRILVYYSHNNPMPFDEYAKETGWLLEDSECDYSTRTATSSPFLFLGADEQTEPLINTLQFALNTPALKLSEYGFTGESTKNNDNIVSQGKLCEILFFNPIFSRGQMSFFYPSNSEGYFKGNGYDKTQNLPSWTFVIMPTGSGFVNIYLDAAKLMQIKMIDDYNDGKRVFFNLEKSKTSQFLAGLTHTLGDFVVNGVPAKVNTNGDSKSITIFNSELSVKLTKYFLGIILEPDNLKTLNDTWKNNGISESEILKMNDNLKALMNSDSAFQLGFSFKQLEGDIFYYNTKTGAAKDIYLLMHGAKL